MINNFNRIIISILILTLYFSCSKDNDQEELNLAPSIFSVNTEVLSATVVNITWETAIDPEGHGVYYLVELNEEQIGDRLSNQEYILKNLTPSTSYIGKIIAIDSRNNRTLSNFSFTTKDVAQVETFNVLDINLFSAEIGGKLINQGNSKIIEVGLIIGMTMNPTIENNFKKFELNLDNQNEFQTTLTNISENTTYYLRAYAVNNEGVGYGNEVMFSSPNENNIYTGNVILNTQEEVIVFGANNYTTIDGSLLINGNVTELTPLESLVIVNNSFTIKNTVNLKNLEGLNNLRVTGKRFANGFRIQNNSALESLYGLNSLEITYGETDIINNNNLTNLEGLNNYIGVLFGEFRIQDCDGLQNLSGLENLSFVNYYLYIINNKSLNDLSALSNLSFVGERVNISNNSTLENLNGFNILTTTKGIDIFNNKTLISLDGLRNLVNVSESISIKYNDHLNDLTAFQNITTTEYITIEYNNALTSLNGLNNLISINNNIIITSNSNLLTLAGLENLSSVDGVLQIHSNSLLGDFCPIKPLLLNDNNLNISIYNNLTNPSTNDILNDCN
jgi:hypothetical protein